MADGVQQYQELIGQLRWSVEIGRLYILLEMLLLSRYLAMPPVGHLKQAFYIFGCLKAYLKRKLVFDPEHPATNKKEFQQCDWKDFYKNVEETIPGNIPVSRGNFMLTYCFVKANHASDTEARLSQIGILLFYNSAPIIYFNKRQNSFEASTFLLEFTAMNNEVEII